FFFFFGWGRKNRVEITLDLDFKTYNNEEMHQMIAQELSEKALKGALAPQHIAVIDTREGSIIMIVAFSLSGIGLLLLASYAAYKCISFRVNSRQDGEGGKEWKVNDEVVFEENTLARLIKSFKKMKLHTKCITLPFTKFSPFFFFFLFFLKMKKKRPTKIRVKFDAKKFYWIRGTENFNGDDPAVQSKEPGVDFCGDISGIFINFLKKVPFAV
ncbi:hypothetical protein RFI_07391, partial [Reticulomyxa filosa]